MTTDPVRKAAEAMLVQVVSQGHVRGPIEGFVATSPERLQAAADNLRAALDASGGEGGGA